MVTGVESFDEPPGNSAHFRYGAFYNKLPASNLIGQEALHEFDSTGTFNLTYYSAFTGVLFTNCRLLGDPATNCTENMGHFSRLSLDESEEKERGKQERKVAGLAVS